jgi:TPR repeat protein
LSKNWPHGDAHRVRSLLTDHRFRLTVPSRGFLLPTGTNDRDSIPNPRFVKSSIRISGVRPHWELWAKHSEIELSASIWLAPGMKSASLLLRLVGFLLLAPISICAQTNQKNDIQALKTKAEGGDAQAQYNLGVCLYNGIGVEKNHVEAVKWYRKAAEQDDPLAQFNLGYCYENADGVLKDEVAAVEWYRKAAEQNNARAQVNLGSCYAEGTGVPKDDVEAVKWYRKAAEQNVPQAQFALGVCYENGGGLRKDDVEAVKWYRKAAEQNLAPAQFNLGNGYHNGIGVEKDDVEAAKWYRKAAEQGNAFAQLQLGVCYYNGSGAEKDYVEAVKWCRKAAEQNLAPAQLSLGECYASGEGVTKDEAEAVTLYRKAAEQNFAPAQFKLGFCFENGQGVAKDYVEAVNWYRKSAEQNDATAQCNLGLCYADGKGVPKDYVEAYKWYNLALAQGQEVARQNLSNLERFMTPDQIAEAQKLAREFKPQKAKESGLLLPEITSANSDPTSSGTGFFITDDGYLISNYHVVKDANHLRVLTSTGLISARVVRVDPANDVALLKAEGRFRPLPIKSSLTMKLGNTVATVGFPDIGLQGFSPKLAKGEIASLSGAQDDPRYFQISVPVQPGNSGSALVDERGNVVGIVSGKLDASVALAASGALPENVNYAVKSSFVLSFLESMPEVSAKLKEPITSDRKFDDVVQSAQAAAALVLVY